MSLKKNLIIVGGATASGKTGLAIRLAQHFQTSILSSDSRQFYKELSIGTAKATPEEQAQAPHYFVDSISIEQNYSVGDFEREALELLNQLLENKDEVILAGGSGLYINALCQGLDEFPEVSMAVRDEVEAFYQQNGLEALQQELIKVDPNYSKEVDLNNPHRLMRALSVYRASGQAYSSFLKKKEDKQRNFSPIYLQIFWEREQLYQRINKRVDLMMKAGLLEEAKAFFPKRQLTALQTVGYQELFSHFAEEIDLTTAIELIKRNSRRYAKRQLTWMRRDGFWKQFKPAEWELILKYVRWIKEFDYVLYTSKIDDKNYKIGFKSEEETVQEFSVSEKKQYTILRIEKDPAKEILFWLLHEINYRCKQFPLFLLIPISLEPFAKESGFVANAKQTDLPAGVQRELLQQPDFRCYRKESRE